MTHSFDLVIRGGTVADGSGAALREADVGIRSGGIAAVAEGLGPGAEEIDANGMLVTPGFVDVHTHYDGQVTWSGRLTPSSYHGVTTVVTGNCGVGFAPCHPDHHDLLLELMAGVEDIPEVVMGEGLTWDWESFPQYLDAVDARPHDIDIAAMIPHSALRVYVMGQRAVAREEATADDIAKMADLTRESIEAGALGFGTSRALHQRSSTGESIPTVRSAEDELSGILTAMKECGSGVFQLISDFYRFQDVEREFAMLRRLVEASGRPTSFSLNQKHTRPDDWRYLLELTASANDAGIPITAQVLGRPTGLLLGHDLTLTPFSPCATYAELARLTFDRRIAELRRPEVREKVVAESVRLPPELWSFLFEIGDPPNYEPTPDESIAARAARQGVSAPELAFDTLMRGGGTQLLLHAIQNYANGSLAPAYEMMRHPNSILGLGDGGAHFGLVCDASYPTTMLSFWTRDRTRGPRLSVPEAVRLLTRDTAFAVGLRDRGCLAPGFKADVNVIDYERLRERQPTVVRDMPAGGRRLIQRADGYVATVVNGVVTYRLGEPTGALPGRLVRGARSLGVARPINQPSRSTRMRYR
jgi:N-acyl-D-amino-acid deacylase